MDKNEKKSTLSDLMESSMSKIPGTSTPALMFSLMRASISFLTFSKYSAVSIS